jgi:two-component system sensor histidine kinase/response regulator
VRDTGIGLSEEQKDRLFESFQQADSSTTRKYRHGAGAGDQQRLAALMGGEGGGGHGWGRARPSGSPARLRQEQRAARAAAAGADLRGKKMLVVDDNARAQEILGSCCAS